MASDTGPLKESVHLRGYDEKGAVVFEEVVPLYDYYEELHDVIDSSECRAAHALVKLVGTKYDGLGAIEETWENTYSESGDITGGTIRDGHGNITRALPT